MCMEQEAEIRRRSRLIKLELEHFEKRMSRQMEKRQDLLEENQQVMERVDFSDAVVLLEEEETRRREEAARLRKQRQEEKELRLIQEEQARIAAEKAAEQARIAAEAEEKRAAELQRQRDLQALRPVARELEIFQDGLEKRKNWRYIKTERGQAVL